MNFALKKTNFKKSVTLEDWKNLPHDNDNKYDLISGELVLQAAPSKEHSLIQGDLRSVLNCLRANKQNDGTFEKDKWIFATEAGVIYGEDACTHDLAGWKSDRLTSMSNETYFTLTPDWVCEIVSTNWKNDTILKRNLLEENKVPFYWMITPHDSSIVVLELLQNLYYHQLGIFRITDKAVSIPPFYEMEIDPRKIFNY